MADHAVPERGPVGFPHRVLDRLTAMKLLTSSLRLHLKHGTIVPDEIEIQVAQIEQEIDAIALLAQAVRQRDRVRRNVEAAPVRDGVRRILIVEDDLTVLDTVASLLADEGHLVQTTSDGLFALEMIAAEPPELLITDVLMSGLDGWALIAQAREHTPTLPVIIISAIERREAGQREALITDQTVYVRKPFDIETLLAIVERLTSSRST